ncbi:sensor histidine kinase [Nocardioides marinquilinus]|uniref:histidine kinase n=1 Tax=Nocardioides marinquilinus TaxID=1210400 RepID=A0ABP9P836_9ACTN
MTPAEADAGRGAASAWSLRRRVTTSIVVILGLLVVLIVLVVVSLLGAKSTGDEVIERWYPAVVASRGVLTASVNQETGVRGFAVGGDERLLDPYETYLVVEEDQRAELRELLAGDAELVALLDDLEGALDVWHTDVAEPVIAAARDGERGAAARSGSQAAKARFDAVRQAASALETVIDERRDDAAAARERAFTLVWYSVAFGIAVLLAAALVLWRGLRRSVLDPMDRLAAQTRLVAGGDLERRIEPTGPAEVVALAHDVDVMRERLADELARVERARAVLERRGAELARSNADLEQFAYVASHDLSEPLRKVTNFCQLLERQYADQLDDKARTYIGFMVDGARRMQVLITDLLAFSRVGRSNGELSEVDLEVKLERATSNLETAIAEAGATVTHGPLPQLPGDPTLLTALLQNLVGNAVKYRDPDRPQRVHVSAELDGASWVVTVDDEGIGIEPQYAERIFTIFQRLHLRGEYEGTGIGLALCRKIVDFHGGRIWLAEKDGPGARFRFTLPVTQAPVDEVDPDEPSLAAT